jgi:cytochrome c oxidase subunit II
VSVNCLFAFLLLAAALPSSISQSALYPAGPQAATPYDLWNVFVWLFATLWVIVVGFIIFGLFYRGGVTRISERAGEKAVATGAGLTALILLVLIIISSAVAREIHVDQSQANELNVRVTGHQWWWEFQYRNGPADHFLTTANELHIPIGQTIRVEVRSGDVIHSFWVPSLSPKIDAIPNHFNEIVFQADKAGTYRGQCAEFCGRQHAHMGFLVVAETPADFNNWFNHQLEPSQENLSAEEQQGRQVFLSSPCVVCHRVRGTSALGGVAPDLTHLASRATIGAALLSNTPGNLSGWITDSQRVKPGTQMPPIDIASQDMQPLLSYLDALK